MPTASDNYEPSLLAPTKIDLISESTAIIHAHKCCSNITRLSVSCHMLKNIAFSGFDKQSIIFVVVAKHEYSRFYLASPCLIIINIVVFSFSHLMLSFPFMERGGVSQPSSQTNPFLWREIKLAEFLNLFPGQAKPTLSFSFLVPSLRVPNRFHQPKLPRSAYLCTYFICCMHCTKENHYFPN